jgi:hypothetical protein
MFKKYLSILHDGNHFGKFGKTVSFFHRVVNNLYSSRKRTITIKFITNNSIHSNNSTWSYFYSPDDK